MGTTLEGKQINQTYQGLLKTTDNAEVSGTAKEITDGKGNGTGVTLDNAGNVTATSFTGDGSGLTNLPSDAVSSVNTQTGAVVLDTDDIGEGTSNLYYTDARVSANTDVVANTAKTGITTAQANEITANTAKVGITPTQASEISANTLKTGITTQQASDITANNAKVTRRPITAGGNTLETSESLTLTAGSNVTITEAAGTVTIASTGGVGSVDLGTSTTTTSVTVTNSGGTDATISEASSSAAGVMSTAHHDKLDGIAAGAEVNTVDSVNGATGAVSLDTADLTDVSATAPTNGQVLQYNSTSSNYEPVTLSSTAPVDSVNGQTGAVVLDADDISDAATTNKFTTAANLTKLGTIEENADVTDTANVTAAGALMDSEVDADIKTLSLPANTTISAFAQTILDDADASAVRTTIGAGTSNLALGTTAGTALEGDTVIPTNNNQLTNGAGYTTNTGTVTSVSSSTTNQLTVASGTSTPALSVVTGTVADAGTALATGDQIHTFVTGQGYITGNETVTLSGDITGSGTTAITASIANNVVGADELNVSGNGTSGQVLASDGDGTFSWADAGGGSYTPNIVSGATTASKDNLYIFTASATLTLPASPSGGDSIKVSNLSGTTTCVIARNGSNIMAVGEDMTLDNQYASFELIYGDATRGWVVVGGN